jgi:ABC-type uncharacterized transport system ATPase component
MFPEIATDPLILLLSEHDADLDVGGAVVLSSPASVPAAKWLD